MKNILFNMLTVITFIEGLLVLLVTNVKIVPFAVRLYWDNFGVMHRAIELVFEEDFGSYVELRTFVQEYFILNAKV